MTPPPVAAAVLPSLPEPLGLVCGTTYNPPKPREFFGIVTGHVPDNKCDVFTADQMQAYALAAIAAQQQPRIPARVTIADARDYLNTNDKAFWVTGWNECVESMLASAPQPPQQAGPEIQGDLAACDRGGVKS
jgi:hypothetical protein